MVVYLHHEIYSIHKSIMLFAYMLNIPYLRLPVYRCLNKQSISRQKAANAHQELPLHHFTLQFGGKNDKTN